MTIELGTLLALIVTIVGAAAGYAKNMGRIDGLLEKVDNLDEWKISHEADAQAQRQVYDVRLTSFEVRLGRGEEKFEQISRDIGEIKKDVRTLLTRRRDDRGEVDRRDAEA